MLSRAADAVYWMQRYRERAENTARLLDVNIHLAADAPREIGNQWEALIKSTGDDELFRSLSGKPVMKDVVHFLAFERENPNSIVNCTAKSRENARAIRGVISSEMWQEINTVHLFVQKTSAKFDPRTSTDSVFTRIKRQCQLITGIADTTMSHNEAWCFGRMGNLLERADMCTRLLDAKCFMLLPENVAAGSPFDNIQWSALLKSTSAYEMYRQTRHQILGAYVVDFLLLDRNFPRSVYSCLTRLAESIRRLGDASSSPDAGDPAGAVRECLARLGTLDGEAILSRGLHEFLDRLQLDFQSIHGRIHERYFSLAPVM